jgi:hypothetical protein
MRKNTVKESRIKEPERRLATSRVCQKFTRQILCFPACKNICQVRKRVNLQQFGIIYLSNPDLTYIEKQNYLYTFSPLENLHQESFFTLYFLFPLPPIGKNGNHDPYFCQVSIFVKFVCQTVEVNFSCFAKIRWMSSWFDKLLELLTFPRCGELSS